jgi:lysine 2,3-aminomutase
MATLNTLKALAGAGLLPDHSEALERVAERYAVAITPGLTALIDRSDPRDPIARQFVPSVEELVETAEERADPIGDGAHSPVAGIVHRHKDRVLLKAAAACPVYCRFCFRRESVGPTHAQSLSAEEFETALSYVGAHREIWEVILTGGDPFVLSPRRVREISERIAGMEHIKVLRWHTRVPVVDPARVDVALIEALRAGGATTWVAIHANHPREFTPVAMAAIGRLVDAGIPLVSQSVLLKGINADADTLEALMRLFVVLRIKPYYLHHPDLARGTSHFRVTIEEGLELMRVLRRRLSGLAIANYVIDIPGGFGKVSLESRDVERTSDGRWRIRDSDGCRHVYPPVIPHGAA